MVSEARNMMPSPFACELQGLLVVAGGAVTVDQSAIPKNHAVRFRLRSLSGPPAWMPWRNWALSGSVSRLPDRESGIRHPVLHVRTARSAGFLPGQEPADRGRMNTPPLPAAQPFGQLVVGCAGLSHCGKLRCCVKSVAHKRNEPMPCCAALERGRNWNSCHGDRDGINCACRHLEYGLQVADRAAASANVRRPTPCECHSASAGAHRLAAIMAGYGAGPQVLGSAYPLQLADRIAGAGESVPDQ